MPLTHINTLLSQTQIIESHFKAIEKLSGENFNLLKLLKMGHYEVKTHSPILADLLSPKGTHGQGATFLKLFVKLLNIADFDPESASVSMEKSIGEVTLESGGRIDLYITDGKGRKILIENKIYAREQENQLSRYYKYGDSKGFFGSVKICL